MDVQANIEVVEAKASIQAVEVAAALAVVEAQASIAVVDIQAPIQDLAITASIEPVNINVALACVGPKGDAGVSEDEVPYDKETDQVEISATVNHFYIGEADPGAAFGDPVWRIKRRVLTETGDELDISEKYADGVATFTKVWDDRLTYTY